MKSRFLIILGIIVVIAMSLLSYAIYEPSTKVFITCDPQYDQINSKCVNKTERKGEKSSLHSEPETKNMECVPTDYEKTRKCLANYHCDVDENPTLNEECIEVDQGISVREMCSNPDNIIIQKSNGCMVLPLVNSKSCGQDYTCPELPSEDYMDIQCSGKEQCMTGKITRIVDGDTIYLDGYGEIRLSLTNTPERHETGFYEASQFTAELCSVGTNATVDQDDEQPIDMFGRILGKMTCGNKVLNSELLYEGHANILTRYCSTSEFSNEEWAQEFGC